MLHKTNLLLDALANGDREAVLSRLRKRELRQRDILFEFRQPITEIYFPIDAVVSHVIPLATGETVEAAMTGRDGVIGATAALNGRIALNRAVVEIGGASFHCDVDCFKGLIKGYQSLLPVIAGHEQALFAQAQQSAACNVMHNIENRLARWLLRAADLSGSDELHLTQEYIAEMLGVRRTSVTLVARTLQQAGMIKYARGRIKLIDLTALRDTACECYETVKMNYDAALRPSNEFASGPKLT